MTGPVFLGRPLPGVVGETRRVCHVFPVPPEGERPAALVALCGAKFGAAQLELLDGPRGMPCELCLRAIPTPPEIGSSSGR